MPADVSDLKKLATELRNVRKDVTADTLKITRDSGERIQKKAKATAPVETGELRNSIKVSKSRSRQNISVTVTAESDHAVFQEFGTTRNPPRPFMRPALEAEIEPFVRDLIGMLGDVL